MEFLGICGATRARGSVGACGARAHDERQGRLSVPMMGAATVGFGPRHASGQ